jgi:hypothetical protein
VVDLLGYRLLTEGRVDSALQMNAAVGALSAGKYRAGGLFSSLVRLAFGAAQMFAARGAGTAASALFRPLPRRRQRDRPVGRGDDTLVHARV